MSILGARVSQGGLWALVAAMVCAGGLFPLLSKSATQDIVLVARDMAFYVDGMAAANPMLEVRAGASVRVVLRNADRGMRHDFAVPALGVAMELVPWNEREDISFTAPTTPGSYAYVCRPHGLIMRGVLRVTE